MLNKSIFFILSLLTTVVFIGIIISFYEKPLPIYSQFPAYSLNDLSEQTYNFDNDKIKLVTFFYTRCPDICPITMQDLIRLHKELDEKEILNDVHIVVITLDPEQDTKEVLKQYQQMHQIPEDESWFFLRGTNETITNLTDDLGYYRERTGEYWAHSTTMYLVDSNNRKRAFFLMSKPEESINIDEIIQNIQMLQKEL